MAKRTRWTTLLIAVWLLASACQSPRVYRLTEFSYTPKPSDAAVELSTGQIKVAYTPIAIVDSRRYTLRDYYPEATEEPAILLHNASKDKHAETMKRMRQDLKDLARELGGDAVHKMRLLSAHERGMVPDPTAPIPGAIKYDYSKRYFYRGELVKFIEERQDETQKKQKKDNEL